MKTMEKLIKRFERLHPDYEAHFNDWESCPGYYVIFITQHGLWPAEYIFSTLKDFREWMDGVVLD